MFGKLSLICVLLATPLAAGARDMTPRHDADAAIDCDNFRIQASLYGNYVVHEIWKNGSDFSPTGWLRTEVVYSARIHIQERLNDLETMIRSIQYHNPDIGICKAMTDQMQNEIFTYGQSILK